MASPESPRTPRSRLAPALAAFDACPELALARRLVAAHPCPLPGPLPREAAEACCLVLLGLHDMPDGLGETGAWLRARCGAALDSLVAPTERASALAAVWAALGSVSAKADSEPLDAAVARALWRVRAKPEHPLCYALLRANRPLIMPVFDMRPPPTRSPLGVVQPRTATPPQTCRGRRCAYVAPRPLTVKPPTSAGGGDVEDDGVFVFDL